MQRKVIALSRCLEVPFTRRNHGNLYQFHFKGVYFGHSIVEIHLAVEDNKVVFHKNYDYLLYIDVLQVADSKLVGRLIRFKRV